jgi:tetratricopeptide (TPR) repeat protein
MPSHSPGSPGRGPIAQGHLSTTSLAELLVLALERRLSGSFVFQSPVSDKSALVVASGRVTKVRTAEPVEPLGRLLTESGVIDAPTLEHALRLAHQRNDRLGDALIQLDALDRGVLERTLREQLGRRLSWLGQLPEASAYGFYANVDFLEDRPECGTDPLALIWRCIREGRGPHPRQEAVLSALGARPLRLASRAMLDRFELPPRERACFESLRTRPLALEALVELTGLEYVRARRSVYALLMTRQLEPQPLASTLPPPLCRSSPPASDALPPSFAAPMEAQPPSRAPSSLPPPCSVPLPPSSMPPARASSMPPAPVAATPVPSVRSSSMPPSSERIEHALERASRLVRERTRAEGAADATRAIESARESISRKQFSQAEALVRKACSLDPNNAEYLALHAWVRMQNGELGVPALAAQIVAALDRAVMKAPTSVTVRFQRAQVLKRLGRDDEAYKDFRFVARRNPELIDAVREVRLHLMRTRNKQKQSGVFSKLFLR